MRRLLFVYGSLMREQYNHGLLERVGARFEGPARSEDGYSLVDLGAFPAMIFGEADEHVVGELYSLEEADFEPIDRLEGHPRFYRRVEIGARLASAEAEWVRAESYLMERAVYLQRALIEGGDWRAHLALRRPKELSEEEDTWP